MTSSRVAAHSRKYSLYQLCIISDFPLLAESSDSLEHDVEFVRADASHECPFIPSTTTLRYENPVARLEIHECNSTYCMSYAGIADFFIVNEKQVICHVSTASSDALIASLLQGPVCAVVLELRGCTCLHASAVMIDRRCVAFMGHTGAGKSSLAMQFISNGWPLVTDDILALNFDAEACQAIRGYAQVKLRPDMEADRGAELSAARIANGRFEPSLGKYLYDLPDNSIAPPSAPLDAVYILQRESAHQTLPVIECMSPADGFVELLRFGFCSRAIGTLGLEAARFYQFGRIAEMVRVKRLRYASGRENLNATCQAIVSDLGAG